jgi:RNA polymerase sigma-70 factor (ECF subfamily)
MVTRAHEDAATEMLAPSTSIEQVYADYYQPIQRYLERLVGHRETAEDLAHETFIKALRHWRQLEQATSVRGWLYRIATNTAYDHLRRGRRIAMVPLLQDAAAQFTAHELRIDDAEPIRAVLKTIPDMYRIPLMLHIWAGYPLQDIADALGINVATIKTRIHRARAQFRRLYVA